MKLMLLCAGEGTRFRPQTLTIPKPEIPFLTVPMAAYSLEWVREISPRGLVVNTFHLPSRIHDLFARMNHGFGSLAFSDEAPLLMGSGGGIKKAQALLGHDPFVVMNGDEVFLPNAPGQLRAAQHQHMKNDPIATLMVINYPGVGTTFGGVWTNTASDVVGFGKQAPAGAAHGWHYIGVMFLSPRIFDFLPEGKPSNVIYDGLVSALAQGHKVDVFETSGWWHETGNETDYLKATATALRMLADGEGDQGRFLENLLKRHNPKFELQMSGAGVHLTSDGGQQVPGDSEGFIVLGPGARLSGSGNKNAVLGDGVQLNHSVQNKLIL